jgi:hypothetical protein
LTFQNCSQGHSQGYKSSKHMSVKFEYVQKCS